VPADLRSSFTSEALAELAALPADWPEIEYISGPGYVGNWTTLLFGRKDLVSPN
jgi:choline dehydrogenase